jgi:hypothetical protein
MPADTATGSGTQRAGRLHPVRRWRGHASSLVNCAAAPNWGKDAILWIIAVILVVAGIVALFRRQLLWGIALTVVGLLVGPGGVSVFTN